MTRERVQKSRLEAFLTRGLKVGSLRALAKSFGLWSGGYFPGVSTTYKHQKESGALSTSFELKVVDPQEFQQALTYCLARLQSPPLGLSREAASETLEALLDKEIPQWESEGFSDRTTGPRQIHEARINPKPETATDFGQFLNLPLRKDQHEDS